ncbi:MAG: NPCBM/NEW2 domain-containing protein [Nocardioides sp.]
MTRRIARMLTSLLVAGLLCAVAPAGPGGAAAAGSYSVSATFGATVLTLGDTTTVTGQVSPKAAGKTVTLQRKAGPKWTVIGSKTLTKKSKYRFVLNPDRVGGAQYRVCKAGTARTKAGCSKAQLVSVYRWHYLYDLDSVDDSGAYADDGLFINGTSYKKSIYMYAPGFDEYNVNRKCAVLQTTLGADDRNTTGSIVNAEILTDGTSRFSRNYGVGQSESVTVDLTNALRLRIESAEVVDEGDDYLGVGSPRIYCKF